MILKLRRKHDSNVRAQLFCYRGAPLLELRGRILNERLVMDQETGAGRPLGEFLYLVEIRPCHARPHEHVVARIHAEQAEIRICL